jgi:parvulin-like peptidyl-prolyl isomerase
MSRGGRPEYSCCRRRRVAAACMAVAAATAWPTAAAAADPAADPRDDVLVTAGDEAITRSDLTAFLARTRVDLRAVDGRQRQALAAAALERLVDERLLRAAVSAAGITVEPARVAAAVDQLRAQLKSSRRVSLEQMLEQSGGDADSLRKQIEFDLAVARLVAPRIDAAAIDAAFEKHRRDLDGTRVRVSHVVLRPDVGEGDDAVATAVRKAADIRAAILRQELSFAEAAARHSAGPSRHRGGDLGFLPRHGDIHEAFAREAFALQIGGLSQPFATPFGVHLVTVTEVTPGTATPEQLRPKLEQLAAQDAIRQLVAELRRTTRIAYSPEASQLGDTAPGDE